MEFSEKLNDLNARLEKYFALKRKLANERTRIQKVYDEDIIEIKRLHTVQLAMIEKHPEEPLMDVSALKTDNARQRLLIKKIKNGLDIHSKRYAVLEAHKRSLLSKLGEQRTETLKWSESSEEIASQLYLSKAYNQGMTESLTVVSRKVEEVSPQLQEAQNNLEELKEKLRKIKACHKDESINHRMTVDTLTNVQIEKEMKMQKDYETRMGEIQSQELREKEKITEQEKEYYANEFRKCIAEIVQKEGEVDSMQKETTRLRMMLQKGSYIDEIKLQIAELDRTSDAKDTTLSEFQKRYETNVKAFENMYQINSEKFEIAKQMGKDLAPELKAYELLVQKIETYSPSPKKKRKSPSITSNIPRKASLEKLRIQKWRNNYITLKNVTNTITPLLGWRLRSNATNLEFIFPTHNLQPHSSLKIWTEIDAKKANNELMWEALSNQLIPLKDEIQLIDPSGNIKSSLKFVIEV